jgi:diguanylate cyclase (GGDEF)-like protein
MTATAAVPSIRVLLTEDVPADVELEVRELKRAGLRFAHRVADSEQSFIAALREFTPDVILSDFSMPGFDGMAALALARELCPDTPFVFVSGTIGEEYAIRALKNGATDYVLKSNLLRLPAAVERALAQAKERRELRRAEVELVDKQDRINYLALYDALTGLPNRRLFHDRLTQAIDAARGSAQTLALVMYDLERFKAINDTFGQHTGDRVLQAVAKRLLDLEGDLSRIVRLESNLFAIIFTVVNGVEDVARRLESASRRLFGERLEIDGREIRLAARAGIAVYPEDGTDADALFRNAEAALKQAKSTGEHYLFYAPQINARVAEQFELEHRLRLAIERREIFLHFQPKYDLASRRMVGLEALMRWKGPAGVLMSPARFVPVLEQTGLIFEAGQQVLAAASAAYREWDARGLKPPRIAVNVSAVQLRRRSFVEDVRAALGDTGTEGGGVDLEITESLLMTDVDQSIRKLGALRSAGMRIALDDFGTGYSSLAYLSKLPIDTLKIDRSFVHGMTENPADTSIVSTIISLAQALRFKVVAEGVETEQQAQMLRLLRCDQVQGYLFSPPVPAERIETLLAAQTA